MAKKNIKIAELIDLVNEHNRLSEDDTMEYRMGQNLLLEEVLHLTGNYKGYGYLDADQVPLGFLPGIVMVDGEPTFPDESRRRYIK